MSEMRQQMTLMDERMFEMKDNVIKLEQKRNKPVLQAASFADAVRMPNPN